MLTDLLDYLEEGCWSEAYRPAPRLVTTTLTRDQVAAIQSALTLTADRLDSGDWSVSAALDRFAQVLALELELGATFTTGRVA